MTAVRIAEKVRSAYLADLGPIGAFLPQHVPLETLPGPYQAYLDACAELPQHYPAQHGGVRDWLDRQFAEPRPADVAGLGSLLPAQQERLVTALSVLAHAYRWDTIPPSRERFSETRIRQPAAIGPLWTEAAQLLGQPEVGTTWSMHLCNWHMTDRPGGSSYRTEELSLDNLRVAHQWLTPPFDRDLERFSLSFVLMEAAGAKALRALVRAIEAAARQRAFDTAIALSQLKLGIKALAGAFTHVVRDNSIAPTAWLEYVQPTFAWAAEDEHGPLEGPSGMQLGTLQCLDTALGVAANSFLAKETRKARRYLPPAHQHFLTVIDEAGDILPTFVETCGDEQVRFHANACVKWLRTFRLAHAARGARYLRAGREGENSRVSTGLGINWRAQDDDPVATFTRAMAERITETNERYF